MAAAGAHGQGSGRQTAVQSSPSERCTNQSLQSHGRDCEERSSSFAGIAAFDLAPCISRRFTGLPQSPASTARRGSGMHPTAGFPGSPARPDLVAPAQSLAALPAFVTSSANKYGNQPGASAAESPAEPPGPHRAGSAKTEPSKS